MAIPPERNRAKVKAWRLANPERYKAMEKARREKHREKRKAMFAAWRAKNRDKVRKTGREYAARRRARLALEAAAQAKMQPRAKVTPKISALLKLAEAKATQGTYGIQRIAYQERR